MQNGQIFTAYCGAGDMCSMENAFHTQYGHTIVSGKLCLHMGDHLFRKRGGAMHAFTFDAIDYRYESLMKSLGLPANKLFGFLLGNLYDKNYENGQIRFRITEECPTDIMLAIPFSFREHAIMKSTQYIPDAITEDDARDLFYAVYSLARPNCKEEHKEWNDDYFDIEPDEVDLSGDHYHSELSAEEIIKYRLSICGF
jgi:hypothetical protein